MSASGPPKALLRLTLSHHPTCLLFAAHTYRVGRVRLCVGCFTAYPIAILTSLAVIGLHPPVAWPWILGLGITLGLVQVVSFAGLARTKAAKVAVKAALGLGIGLTVAGTFLAPWNWGARWALLLGFAAAGTVGLLPTVPRMLAVCSSCMHQRDWDRCPGVGLKPAA